MSSRPTMTDEDSQLPTTDATSERRSNRSALAMVHATDAIDYLLNNSISDATLLESHRMFMANAGVEAMYASRYRKVQNWIAGSDYSPRGALYVPPPPQEIPQRMPDLLTFSNRRDIPVLVQASVMHAQFENIHLFTDGNGRIGRAMLTALLRQRGHTRYTTIPICRCVRLSKAGLLPHVMGLP